MPLHEFMAEKRDQILRLAVGKLSIRVADDEAEAIGEDLPDIYDEIVRALRRDAGIPETSPLPGGQSPSAQELGRHRVARRAPIWSLAYAVGAISDAMGELAGLEGRSFGGREYQVFNQCVDAAVAAAVDEYWQTAGEARQGEARERIGMLAHELRNHLGTAHMSLEVLKRGQGDDASSRPTQVLERSLMRMQALVEQTLASVRTEAGQPLRKQRVRLAELLREATGAVSTERGVRVEVASDEGLDLEADPALLASAVSNLVQNGVKFSRPGGRVHVRVRAESGAVVIEVEDECGGLPPGMTEELFAPFVQRSPDRRGVGLGLKIAREAARAHGGDMSVRDLPGKGCVFSLRVPAA